MNSQKPISKTSKSPSSKVDNLLQNAVQSTFAPKRPGEIRTANLSDLHLAHPRTNVFHMVERLREMLPDNEETAALDIIFLAGDVFDHLLNLPQVEVDAIQEWVSDLLDLCAKHNILLRVLEGTPSHDWGQSQQFTNINESKLRPAKLKYVETLSIETIDELGGLTVLYVPDEWNAEAHTTKMQVMDLMRLHGLTQVDIGCMHGSFDYQLPIDSVKNHDSSWYKSIVRYYITIGHIHIRSENDHILAQGSPDRFSHGEEAPKGHYRVFISPEKKVTWKFVENTRAKIYETIDCRDMDLEHILNKFHAREHYPDGSAVRLLVRRGDTLQRDLKAIRKHFPQFKITTHLDDLKRPEAILARPSKSDLVKPITINTSNVKHLVLARIESQGVNLQGTERENLQKVLEKHM